MTTQQIHYGREEKHRAYLLSNFWPHVCAVTKTWTSVERGCECDLCGAREDETRRPQ